MRAAGSTIASPLELPSERADRARWEGLRGVLGATQRAPKRAALGAIGLYRMTAPVRTPRCRYIPSCSAYAAEAIEVHGLGRGLWLAMRRLGRCHPFGSFGFDPVPERIDHQHEGAGPCDGSTEHGETSAPERSDGTECNERDEHGTQPERT